MVKGANIVQEAMFDIFFFFPHHCLQVKRDYVEGLGDSLDLVPVGAWYGNGRKAGWYSPFLMACYNPETEEFQSVCRVMSGFSDEFYKQMKEFYSGERILPKKPVYYKTDEQPEVWFTVHHRTSLGDPRRRSHPIPCSPCGHWACPPITGHLSLDAEVHPLCSRSEPRGLQHGH